MTKFLNISTDNTLGGASPSDETVSSQKAIKEYVDGLDGNVVHKTGAENVGGVKTFTSIPVIKTSQPNLWMQTSSGEKGTAPTSTQYYWLGTILDKNGNAQSNKLCQQYVSYFTTGNIGYNIDLFKPESGSTVVAQSLGLYCDLANTYSVATLKSGTNITNRNLSFPTNSTTSENIATMGWVNNATTATNVVHRDSAETITATKTFNTDQEFLGLIKGSNETGSNKTNHAIALGHHNLNHMDFYEYGGVFRFYKSRGGTNTLLMELNDTTSSIMQPTEDTTTSSQIDTVGARNTKLASYLPTADQGNLLPNFDKMSVLQTIEFDTADSNWHQVFTRTNTETSEADCNDVIYFRITVTGTSIKQVADFGVLLTGRINQNPIAIMKNLCGNSNATYGGFRYYRIISPKALNSGYGYAFEVVNNRNNNARHYKVEVFKTNSKVTWVQGTASTLNGTYQNSFSNTAETAGGYNISYLYGKVQNSDYASSVTGNVRKLMGVTVNQKSGTSAILANQFVFFNGGKIYPATSNTTAIEVGYGLQPCVTAYNANSDVGWEQLRQKCRIGDLTNIPHATLAKGDPCYFRCTTDSSGNIYSDNYVATSMSAGYTWYYIGIAESATAIDIDTTQSIFMTLDADGKLTHVNGKGIAADLSSVATLSGNNAFTGTNTVPTPTTGDNSQQIANTAWVNANASFGAAPRDVTELYDHGYALVNSNMSIQLSESWKNFDEIVVMAKYSTGNLWPWRVSTYWLDKGLTDANTIIWTNGVGDYLTLASYSESTPTTDTVFKVANRNLCYLGKIYGVNRKS